MHREACAENHRRRAGVLARPRPVLRPDAALVCLDDLLGDGEAKARILPEGLLAALAVGVEALEDPLELVGPDAGTVILHHDLDGTVPPARDHPHRAVLAAERAGVVDQVVENLAEAAVVADDDKGPGIGLAELELQGAAAAL